MQGFDKCCRKSPYEDLFPDEDGDCTNEDLFTKSEYRAVRKDADLFSYVTMNGELQLEKVSDVAYYFYDCMFKAKKLIEDGELVSKKIISYLSKNADESGADVIDEQVPQCIKLTKSELKILKICKHNNKINLGIPSFDERYRIFTNSSKTVRAYQSPYVFNLCIRRELYAKCTALKSDECKDFRDNIKDCVITIPKK